MDEEYGEAIAAPLPTLQHRRSNPRLEPNALNRQKSTSQKFCFLTLPFACYGQCLKHKPLAKVEAKQGSLPIKMAYPAAALMPQQDTPLPHSSP
jgi:hypothetical protein